MSHALWPIQIIVSKALEDKIEITCNDVVQQLLFLVLPHTFMCFYPFSIFL